MQIESRINQYEDGVITEYECASSILMRMFYHLCESGDLTKESHELITKVWLLTPKDVWEDSDV
jgi:hypothetical protein